MYNIQAGTLLSEDYNLSAEEKILLKVQEMKLIGKQVTIQDIYRVIYQELSGINEFS